MKPQILYINKGIAILNDILKNKKARKVFLVNGNNSFKNIKNKIDNILKNYNALYFNQFSINPNIRDVYTGVQLLKSFNPDIIIAIGGGSVLDMAKLIKIFSVQQNKIEEILEDKTKNEKAMSTLNLNEIMI